MSTEFPAVQPDWANLQILHRNTLPPRSRFFVYNSEGDAVSRDDRKARALCLSGKWKFSLSDNPFTGPADFHEPTFDSSQWADIEVPGMWQMQGFGKGPHYTNVQYPFSVVCELSRAIGTTIADGKGSTISAIRKQ